MKNIKNIVVPTDFSTTSHNAFTYAQALAEAFDANVTVIHVNEYYMPASDVRITPIAELDDAPVNAKMTTFLESQDSDVPTMVKTKVQSKVLIGNAIEEITQYSKRDDVDLMVMGMTGSKDFISKIIGSVSLDAANKANCPVILVPRDATWQHIDRIMFAANYESTLPQTVDEIKDFAELLTARIHFVHVNNQEKEDNEEIMDTIWDELFDDTEPNVAFEMHTIYRGDVIDQLQKYADHHHIDLLAFVNKKRNFWQNFMHYSVTKNIALSTDKPMMILHVND